MCSSSESEPCGIVTIMRPTLRLADILCATIHGQLEALDVGVTPPVLADGHHDAAQRYKDAKLAKYNRYLEAMRESNTCR